MRHRRPSGLRQRFTFAFAFVALAAVGLTTWMTLGAVFSAQEALFDAQQDSTNDHPSFVIAREAFKQVSRTAFSAGLIAFFMASFAAGVITRWFTRPLKALTDGAQRFEAGERGIRLALPTSEDELRGLTEAFNNLVQGLEQQESWRQNMVADIAHDLRTPLSVMRSEIEGMQDGIIATDAAALQRLHNEVLHLTRLVSDLRTLSLVESGGVQLHREDVQLQAFLERIVESFRPAADATASQLRISLPQAGLVARFDPSQMTRVLSNLIDNALRYGGPGLITIAADAHDGRLLISIRDQGRGLSEVELERIFERFYRADSSRSTRKEGSGLGLAIAKAIVTAHDGSLLAMNHPQGGAVFTIALEDSVQ